MMHLPCESARVDAGDQFLTMVPKSGGASRASRSTQRTRYQAKMAPAKGARRWPNTNMDLKKQRNQNMYYTGPSTGISSE